MSRLTPRRCPDALRLSPDRTQWHLTTPTEPDLPLIRLEREDRLVLQAELETAEGKRPVCSRCW
ncbi:hypothetical protein [Deinococcus multiflagellatus]|uniref:Uncharacterized protein n=1 Tax=Deinococcus multiflagellatus TaxID=1656887 RepID=A0ABW1ZVA6_9DEIO